MNVLFVQKNTHRAGAQTCLARLLCHPGFQQWQPAAVCDARGWLTDKFDRCGVSCVIERFPGSRSLAGRLFGNAAFARRVKGQWVTANFPAIVHANDFTEGLLGLQLARILCAKSAIFLRNIDMTRADYFKYGCHKYDLIFAVGDELLARVTSWNADRRVELIYDGVESNEFAPPKSKPAEFPKRVLVIGSPLPLKGWADVTEALVLLEREDMLPDLQFDFTGNAPEPAKNNLGLERLRKARIRFLGRVDKFRELVLGYDLVINPSRMESFGMAAVEVVALGVPLLSSRTGIIEQIIEQPEFLFSPRQPAELACALRKLVQNWSRLDFDAEKCQQRIREKFMIDRAVEKIGAAYKTLLNQAEK